MPAAQPDQTDRPHLLSTRVLALSLLMLAAPFAWALVRWPDNFFTDDSYFYLQVAWNFAHGRGSTFNGLMPTNGYHPLWMVLCVAVYRMVQSKLLAVHVVAALIVFLNLLTLIGVTALLRRARVALPAVSWMILMPFLFTSQLGTEGALSAICIVALVWTGYYLAKRPGIVLGIATGLSAALAILSRLDNGLFVVAITAALLAAPAREREGSMTRAVLLAVPIPLLLCGAYVWVNHHAFGTWLPISGLLKAHSHGEHRLGSNLPHIAWFDLMVIAAAMPVLWRKQRDLFFHVVETPLAAGVIAHAIFIVLVLSSETRWTWYYTVWTLLASVLFSRVVSLYLRGVRSPQWPVLMCSATVLLLLAGRNVYLRGLRPIWPDHGFQQAVVDRGHMGTLLAFDKAGRTAYYSSARIIPLDGLMGDIHLQNELASAGVNAVIRQYQVLGFIGPPQPMNADGAREFCDAVYLSSIRFTCARRADGSYDVTGAEVFARLSGRSAGRLELDPSSLVWNQADDMAVWRLKDDR